MLAMGFPVIHTNTVNTWMYMYIPPQIDIAPDRKQTDTTVICLSHPLGAEFMAQLVQHSLQILYFKIDKKG